MPPVALKITPETKLIVMSDMHRGDGTGCDDFAHNSLLYKCALDHYLREGFTYIELGDAEDLWENKTFEQIYITHTSIYDRLRKFHDPDPEKTRYIKIWGNHDIEWKDNLHPLCSVFPGICVHEAAVTDVGSESRIFFWHGHQVDPKCCGNGAAVSKFFVRYFWPYLQKFGIKDPTRAAVNPGLSDDIDEKLYQVAIHKEQKADILIAGHTHRPVYESLTLTERRSFEASRKLPAGRKKSKPEPVYYNTGSCVHPRCITGIEITMQGRRPIFKLIKWSYDATPCPEEKAYTLTLKRNILEPCEV
ncbi:MAG: hypothetical protein PHP23_09795 [Desulfobacterales bacterium]|nr:hypothetical protein [Desulfobacterales bacterium]MDD4073638.1 hypothetical protein [Desulfobacterales bacterium]MDD4392712.1 hypothetical protein [Desulfobacterales bacterium]